LEPSPTAVDAPLACVYIFERCARRNFIPDGGNVSATLPLEIPHSVRRVFATADEDFERENDEKTSSVYFPRPESPADFAATPEASGQATPADLA
jgi:hypothetical protein